MQDSSNNSQWFKYTIPEPQLLKTFLKEKFPDLSARVIKRAIDQNQCFVNGRVQRFSATQLKRGDLIEFSIETASKLKFDPEKVIYEDDKLFVYDKPSGISCNAEGILALLPGDLILVHRLDKGTSGVLLLAKDKKTEEEINELFRKRKAKKVYFALVDGTPKELRGEIESKLAKKKGYAGQTIYASGPKGKFAKTIWKVKNKNLLRVTPHTGRTHQIRVHLSELGHPILGDFQYGHKSTENRPGRLMLHAHILEILGHTFISKLPEEFKA